MMAAATAPPTFAKVVTDLSLDKVFEYIIPPELAAAARLGARVDVPFGHSRRGGYIIEITGKPEWPLEKLKPLAAALERAAAIPEKLLVLAGWIADYYCCSREAAVRAMLPGAVRGGKIKPRTEPHLRLADPKTAQEYIFQHRLRKAQVAILSALLERHDLRRDQLLKEIGCSATPLAELLKKGLVLVEDKVSWRDPFDGVEIVASAPRELTVEQAAAMKVFEELLANPDRPRHALLLHGVTGSGKTEFYMQALAQTLATGREAIVLVPEIALTPQTVERFRSRFGDRVSVQHSGLSDGERFDEWNRINAGAVSIVVGARSALFAPFRNLGLIIVDEEHEHTYKQEEAPRYHARDTAVMRGKLENALVILGSATPSMESYHNALSGKYALARLTKRVDDIPMPKVRTVDMKEDMLRRGAPSALSEELLGAVKLRVENGEQTIMLLNRRGFAKQMLCQHCGHVPECPDCSISFTYHRASQSLRCHLCGGAMPAPPSCPQCGADDIRLQRFGTERMEGLLGALLDEARVRRMDSDTMNTRKDYEEALNAFRKGDISVLVGTQMIAKGLDFPNVTLVGILSADLGLYMPDFRAVERTFQLLTQVAGRAGRGDLAGEVIIQTFSPFNPAIIHAVNHDFHSFYEEEIEIRRQLNYPPFGHLLAVHFRGADETAVSAAAEDLHREISPWFASANVEIGEPGPCPTARIKKMFRYMLTIQGAIPRNSRLALRERIIRGKFPKGVSAHIDNDAVNLM